MLSNHPSATTAELNYIKYGGFNVWSQCNIDRKDFLLAERALLMKRHNLDGIDADKCIRAIESELAEDFGIKFDKAGG